MRKLFLLVSAFALSIASFGQGFFTETTYRGAFGDTDWTEDWANFNPQYTNYGATTTTINADITSNTTLSGVVSLVNKVYVTNNAELTILPGTVIRGDKTSKSALIITRGSKIWAEGTKTEPIVFTSAFAAGSRGLGDWGGLVILGAAPNNVPSTTILGANGFPVVEGGFDASKANYGGNNPNDNSGILKYVRIEFAGVVFSSNDEINGLTMGSVGSATVIDYVQVSYANDDSFEWFGGNVNCKHLIALATLDDDFDTDFGYSGNVQFGLAMRDATLADQAGDSNGFESDNNGAGNNATPQTSAIFSNMTLIGPYKGSTSNTIDSKHNFALRLRRNTAISVMNSVFTDFFKGLRIEGNSSAANYFTNNTSKFENNIFAGNGGDFNTTTLDGDFFHTSAYNNTSLGSVMDGASIYTDPFNNTAPGFSLVANSPAASGASFSSSVFADKLQSSTTGINQSVDKSNVVTLYPNPSEGSFKVSNAVVGSSVKVYNSTGLEVYSSVVTSPESSFNLNLKSGVYFVIVGKETFKLIVK